MTETDVMTRRVVDLEEDYQDLLDMQRVSWEINFSSYSFSESAFHLSLSSGARTGNVYVYEIDDEIVGWLWLDISRHHERGHVRHIQVKQAWWGRGLGHQIMKEAIEMCRQRGCRKLTLNVTKSNRRAMSLYAHLGFEKLEDNGKRQKMVLDLTRPRPAAD